MASKKDADKIAAKKKAKDSASAAGRLGTRVGNKLFDMATAPVPSSKRKK